MSDHADCRWSFRADFARRGIEVTVSSAPPIVANPYSAANATCPHGVTFWCEPTGDQLMRWAKDGIR